VYPPCCLSSVQQLFRFRDFLFIPPPLCWFFFLTVLKTPHLFPRINSPLSFVHIRLPSNPGLDSGRLFFFFFLDPLLFFFRGALDVFFREYGFPPKTFFGIRDFCVFYSGCGLRCVFFFSMRVFFSVNALLFLLLGLEHAPPMPDPHTFHFFVFGIFLFFFYPWAAWLTFFERTSFVEKKFVPPYPPFGTESGFLPPPMQVRFFFKLFFFWGTVSHRDFFSFSGRWKSPLFFSVNLRFSLKNVLFPGGLVRLHDLHCARWFPSLFLASLNSVIPGKLFFPRISFLLDVISDSGAVLRKNLF